MIPQKRQLDDGRECWLDAGTLVVRQNSVRLCNQELTAKGSLPALCLDVSYVPDPKAHSRYDCSPVLHSP